MMRQFLLGNLHDAFSSTEHHAQRQLTPLTDVYDKSSYESTDAWNYAASVAAYAVLILLAFLLLWPILYARPLFASLQRKYERTGQPITGLVVGDDRHASPAVAAAMRSQIADGPGGRCCGCVCVGCFSTCFSKHERLVFVTYETGKFRMLKSLTVPRIVHSSAIREGTMSLVMLPGQEKSAIPNMYLLTHASFGCAAYVFSACCGIIVLVWAAFFAVRTFLGGEVFLSLFLEWGRYLAWGVLGVIACLALIISYFTVRCIAFQEHSKYLDGGAKYFPSWREGTATTEAFTSESSGMPTYKESRSPERACRIPQVIQTSADEDCSMAGFSVCTYSVSPTKFGDRTVDL